MHGKTFLIFYLFHDLVLRFTFAIYTRERKFFMPAAFLEILRLLFLLLLLLLFLCVVWRKTFSHLYCSTWNNFQKKVYLLRVRGRRRSKLTEASLSMGKSYWWSSIKSFYFNSKLNWFHKACFDVSSFYRQKHTRQFNLSMRQNLDKLYLVLLAVPLAVCDSN